MRPDRFENPTVGDFFKEKSEFQTLLNDAEECARSEWQMTFVADIQNRFSTFGEKMFISEKQLSILRKMTGEME